MAIFHPIQVSCSCGRAFIAEAARSINIRRVPRVRDMILDGSFHQANCPACGSRLTVERPFYYSDPDRGAVFLIMPRGERLHHRRDGKRISAQEPAMALISAGRAITQMRVIYGMDELREKLIAQNAGIDDRHVELLKLFILHEHPFLMRVPRLQISLVETSPTQLIFLAYHHNQPRNYHIQISRFLAGSLLDQGELLQRWLDRSGHRERLDAPERRWVNFRRWTTRYPSLDALSAYAKAVAAGEEVNLESTDFVAMCDALPHASSLSTEAKAFLQILFDYARRLNDGKAQDRLFEVRYGIELEDEWGANQNRTDIDTIWNLLRNLPPNNIEGNVHLKEVELIPGGGGLYQWSGIIQIGSNELGQQEGFEDVLRHEVGHAVHANNSELIDGWLKADFGWRRFRANQSDIDAWVNLMGGWEKWGAIDPKQRVQISNAIVQALGNGSSWDPGPRPGFETTHPWNRNNFGPRLAVERSSANWYQTFPSWYRANGLAFVLNYWYAELLVVKETTLDLIFKMPDRYAAMSHFEFFAEVYSLYYDIDDPQRTAIPNQAADWLDANVGKPDIAV